MIEIIIPAFLMSVILIMMHGYLGLHIISRGVIFVDIALAQLAALGGIFAFLLGYKFHSLMSYLISLFFTFLGALVISIPDDDKLKKISNEVVIGITYVFSGALSILLIEKLPAESEHIKEMFFGNILLVNSTDITKTFLIYSLVGIIHYIFREKFIQASLISEKQSERDFNKSFWNFVFYALFGVVVTSSVELAGVFLVFTFLIVPPSISILLTENFKKRIYVSWIFGVFIMTLGILFSVYFNTPTGPTIVSLFGISFFIVYFKNFLSKK